MKKGDLIEVAICHICNKDAHYVCSICEDTYCETHDGSDFRHQKDVCKSCSEHLGEELNEEIGRIYDEYAKQLSLIKSVYEGINRQYKNQFENLTAEKKLLLNKFCALAETIKWSVSNVCSEIQGMDNQRYRQVKRLIEEEAANVYFLCKRMINENRTQN